MMGLAITVRPAVAKLIRMLASTSDGEALGAVRALERVLKSRGADFHDLARLIETPSPAPPSGGRTEAGRREYFDEDAPVAWEIMVAACVDEPERFTEREQDFLLSMQNWRGEPTPKQLSWLTVLFKRVRRAA
jgi:hypothetical protein